MSEFKSNVMPAQTSPGQTRYALPSQYPGGSEKLARGTGMRVGTANVGTMKGRIGKVLEMASSRHHDFCCLQETRWKGLGPEYLVNINFSGQGVKRVRQG